MHSTNLACTSSTSASPSMEKNGCSRPCKWSMTGLGLIENASILLPIFPRSSSARPEDSARPSKRLRNVSLLAFNKTVPYLTDICPRQTAPRRTVDSWYLILEILELLFGQGKAVEDDSLARLVLDGFLHQVDDEYRRHRYRHFKALRDEVSEACAWSCLFAP